ncbi:MAG: response regulator, partial [Pseudomonadota bacterium]
PFQQANPNEFSDGAGLGLAISKKLVEMMSGHLSLESNVGKGSLFSVKIPLLPTETHPLDRPSSARRKIIGYKWPVRKVLIVDDIEDNIEILESILKKIGFEVLATDNGDDAIAQAGQWQPDVILMDLLMPKVDGFEAIKRIRSLPELQWIPIFAISAAVSEHNRQRSFAAGCDEFINKPVDTNELLEKLGKYLSLSWVYDTPDEKVEGLTISQEITVDDDPSLEHVQHLLALLDQGDIQAVKDYAGELVDVDQHHVAFAENIIRLAEQLAINKIRGVLLSHLKE